MLYIKPYLQAENSTYSTCKRQEWKNDLMKVDYFLVFDKKIMYVWRGKNQHCENTMRAFNNYKKLHIYISIQLH